MTFFRAEVAVGSNLRPRNSTPSISKAIAGVGFREEEGDEDDAAEEEEEDATVDNARRANNAGGAGRSRAAERISRVIIAEGRCVYLCMAGTYKQSDTTESV